MLVNTGPGSKSTSHHYFGWLSIFAVCEGIWRSSQKFLLYTLGGIDRWLSPQGRGLFCRWSGTTAKEAMKVGSAGPYPYLCVGNHDKQGIYHHGVSSLENRASSLISLPDAYSFPNLEVKTKLFQVLIRLQRASTTRFSFTGDPELSSFSMVRPHWPRTSQKNHITRPPQRG